MVFPIPARCLLLAALLLPVVTVRAQQPAPRGPLTQAEVVLLLKSGVSPARVCSLLRQFGADFVASEMDRAVLQAAGADDAVLELLQKPAPPAAAKAPPSPAALAHEPSAPRRVPSAAPTAIADVVPPSEFVPVPGMPRVYVARHEVTRKDYLAYCARFALPRPKDPPIGNPLPTHPILNVTWEDAVAYCSRLTDEKRQSPRLRYRLPTEEEWELAAKAGKPGRTYPWRDGAKPRDYACFGGDHVCGVGSLRPNDLGIYDMAGNAAEWTLGTQGKPVVKGGSWATSGDLLPELAIASRGARSAPYEVGFRLAVEP